MKQDADQKTRRNVGNWIGVGTALGAGFLC